MNWAAFARCSQCSATDGQPCVGRHTTGSYATADYAVHDGALPAAHPGRQTLVQREEFRAALAAHLADVAATVSASAVGHRLNVRVTVSSDARFYELRVGRHWCALPACICEVPGAGMVHSAGGYHAAQLIAHLELAFPARPVRHVARTPGRRICTPRAARNDPTPEQVAALMARHGLTPDGEAAPEVERKRKRS